MPRFVKHQGLRTGHLLALAGALAGLASLWRPWYTVDIPAALRDALSGAGARDTGLFGAMARSFAAALPSSLHASGWQALQGADVVLCVAMLAVLALVVAAAGAFGAAVNVDPAAGARAVAALGGLGLVLCLEHAVNKPGSGAASQIVHVGSGLWIGVAGCALVLVGGLLASGDPEPAPAAPAFPMAPASPAPVADPTASVAPPGA